MRDILHNFIDTFFYIIYLLRFEDLKDYISKSRQLPKSKTGIIHILANGPSLKQTLENMKIKWQKYLDDDFCAVNFLAEDEFYDICKPKYYVISDPQFFFVGYKNSEKASRLISKINENTTWNMNLYVPYSYYKQFYTRIINSRISVIPFHTIEYIGFESLRFWFYKRGLGNGEFGTVVQNAIYCLINLGYKKINLYGVDHNYFDGLVINENNILCSFETHFYDKEVKRVPIPINIGPKDNFTTFEFLEHYAKLFKGHKILNEYARFCGCEILNCTPNSLIDSYCHLNRKKI